ncbi:MAG: hypothetical protein KBS75_06090 [Bacteroidales bacterium]|nr:hypothetical protein [Candidatus Equimonas faecalis]
MKKTIALALLMLSASVFTRAQQRHVVVEEFTGTQCGWCVAGWVLLEHLRAERPETCIPISLHKYNLNDPMYLRAYPPADGVPSYPDWNFNRGPLAEPGVGEVGLQKALAAIDSIAAMPAEAWVSSLTATFTGEADNAVALAATVDFRQEGDYEVAFVITADSLQGTSALWRQSNYIAHWSIETAGAENDPILAQFCEGERYGSDPTSIYYNDVAVATSYDNAALNLAPSLAHGLPKEPQTCQYTVALPQGTPLAAALRKDLLHAVALITDRSTGRIVNALSVPVAGAPAGLADPVSQCAASSAAYTLDGRPASARHSGLNIIATPDGVKKKTFRRQ